MPVDIETILEEGRHISAFPSIVTEIMGMLENPDSTPSQFQDIISKDTLISAKTLKLANSAYYGYSRSIGTISEAVIILGIDTLRSLIIALSAYNILNRNIEGYGYEFEDFWMHSLCTAMLTKKIADSKKMKNLESYFVAGLLHDTGKLLLDKFRLINKERLTDFVARNKVPDYMAEKAIIGWDHAEVGAQLAMKWKFPQFLVDVNLYHHAPHRISNRNSSFVKMVHVADALSYQVFPKGTPPKLNKVVADELALTTPEKERMEDEVKNEILSFMKELKRN
jgi:putative nucleotidyltransferase with HDIG domain